MLGYMHTRMHFAVLGATNLCIRGSRVRRMEIEDGVGFCQNNVFLIFIIWYCVVFYIHISLNCLCSLCFMHVSKMLF